MVAVRNELDKLLRERVGMQSLMTRLDGRELIWKSKSVQTGSEMRSQTQAHADADIGDGPLDDESMVQGGEDQLPV